MFNFIPTAPDDIVVGHTTEAGEWLVSPPYSESGGAAVGQNPTILINEAYITAFDQLIYNDPEGSVVSDLFPGKIIGFETSPADFDTEPTAYRSFSTLSGQSGTSGEASRFVDGRLIGVSGGRHRGREKFLGGASKLLSQIELRAPAHQGRLGRQVQAAS